MFTKLLALLALFPRVVISNNRFRGVGTPGSMKFSTILLLYNPLYSWTFPGMKSLAFFYFFLTGIFFKKNIQGFIPLYCQI
jgi:hypothetical protein